MPSDLCGLVRRDHDDLDRALSAMVDTTTKGDELPTLLDIFQLALAVHAAAEAKVLGALLAHSASPAILRLIAAQARDEHAAQQAAAAALASIRPGSDDWFARALELRVHVIDHAARAEMARWTLHDHFPLDVHRELASQYATERLIVLSRTSPLAVAEARLAAGVS
jgi:hypothetical protein